MVAVLTIGLAVASAGLSPMLPDGFLSGLHDSRSASASRAEFDDAIARLDDTRAQLAELTKSQQKLQETSAALGTRFDGFVQQASGVRTHLETLEKSLPQIIRTLQPLEPNDTSIITGSIGNSPESSSFDAPGGSVTVSRVPLPANLSASSPLPGEAAAEAMPTAPADLPSNWPRLTPRKQ
ncbi:MAG TPA: hypothetical protein VHB74_15285 [Devosia sp.]|nr:hypothetical protein [Devosia sp.]